MSSRPILLSHIRFDSDATVNGIEVEAGTVWIPDGDGRFHQQQEDARKPTEPHATAARSSCTATVDMTFENDCVLEGVRFGADERWCLGRTTLSSPGNAEYVLLREKPYKHYRCPECGAKNPEFLRGLVQRSKRFLWVKRDYCAVICHNCKNIIDWESP